MLALIRNIWQDVRQGENIDLYLTVLLAIALTVLNLFGIGQVWVTPVTMTVLALLAISSLVNRHRLEIIIERLNQSRSDILLEKIPPTFDQDIKNSEQIWLIGVVLTRTISTYFTLLQEKLKKGNCVKVLIVNPFGAANEIVGERTYRAMSPHESTEWILLSLSNLCALKRVSPNNMEIRVIEYPLSFGFLATDLSSPNGVIHAEHYTYKMGDDLPILVFRPDNKQWYEFFKKQIMVLWENGIEWDCEKQSTKAV